MGTCMSSLTPARTRKNSTPRKKRSLRLLSCFRRSGDLKRPSGGGDLVSEEELHRVPGRAFLNGASQRACLFTQQGRKGTNQDAMLVWENFASRDDTVFCGIFDGHGPFGHMVSKKVRDALPLKLCNQWNAVRSDKLSPHQNGITRGSSNSEDTGSISIEEECPETLDTYESETPPEAYFMLRQSFLSAFKQMDKELKLHESIDCFCSGTTAVTLIKQGQDLIIGNVGDSRAVLATRGKDNSLVPVQLTVDLKPNLPGEAARIQQCKGRVFALQDEPEVARVWLPNNDSPGLAMARAFGDFCLKDYGLISVPDISYRQLTNRDEFIVLATDGIWDVLSNTEVVDIVASAPTCSTAARALVDCAVRAWRLKFPTSKTDDCAAICLYLNPSPISNHVSEINSCSTINRSMERVGGTPTNEGNTNTQELNLQLLIGPQLVNADYDHHTRINEIEPVPEVKVDRMNERCHSTRILSDCISTAEEEEWSALEGVTRVNSLVNLPRFSGEGKSTTSET